MTPEQFCYWLQGRAEMQPDNPPSAKEWKMIADHLQLVFQNKSSPRLVTTPASHPFDARTHGSTWAQGLAGTMISREMPVC